nr:tail fiber assembly protein [Xenorhabdus sp. TS4]
MNSDFIAIVAGNITVFHYNEKTHEYISSSVNYLPVGVSIPAHSCIDAPSERRIGYAICRTTDLAGWEYVADHRGETVYNIKTGAAQVIAALGNYPPDTTPDAPATPFDKWDGKQWVTDIAAQQVYEVQQAESQKRQLLDTARAKIDIYQDAVDLDMATDAEQTALTEWRKYRVLLNRVDCSTAPNIDWPKAPE